MTVAAAGPAIVLVRDGCGPGWHRAGLARSLGQLAPPVRAQPLVVRARSGEQARPRAANTARVPRGTDLVEWYFEQGWTDGLPVVPPTAERSMRRSPRSAASPSFVECRVPPRHGSLTREVLAINLVMAGCKAEYAPVVRAALLALTAARLQPQRGAGDDAYGGAAARGQRARWPREIGMNGGANAFGSGNRANATIGRAIRLVLLNVGGGWPGDLDKSTLGHPGKYTYAVAENEAESPWAPYHVEKGFARRGFDRLRHRRRAAAQRHQPCRRRSRRHPRQHLFGDEHDRQQQRGVVAAIAPS